MKSLVVIIALSALLLAMRCTSQPTCLPGELRFIASVTTIGESVTYITGTPTYCVNGTRLPICNASLDEEAIGGICLFSTNFTSVLGFIGTPPGVTAPPLTNTNNVVTNLTCPDGGECTSTIGSSGCSSYGGSYAAVTCTRYCNGEEILYNNNTKIVDGNYVVVGTPVFCLFGLIISFCNDGTLHSNLAQLFCMSIGFDDGVQFPSNSSIYGHLPIGGTFYVSNYTCPDNAISLDNCSIPQASSTPQCYSGELDLVLQCTVAQYTCYPGEINIFNPVNSTANSISYYTGTPIVCVNRSSLPVCNVSLDRSDISAICLYSTGLITGFVGTPSGITAPLLNNTNNVVTKLTCNNSFECTNTTGYSGCSSYGGGYAAITCGRFCSDGVPRLYNNYTTIVDGNIVDIGIPQQCNQGAWSSICNDGTNTNNVAVIVCRFFGYTGGIQLPSNSAIYGSSPLPGTIYYNQFTCPNNTDSFDLCTPQFAGDHCYTGELDFVVQCTRTPCSPGQLSFNTIVNTTIDTVTYMIGTPTVCINGNNLPICNASLDESIVTAICMQFTGLTTGFVGTPPGVVVPLFIDTNYVVTSLTCNDNLECTNTTGSSGCSSYGGGYAVITCGRYCSEGRIYNNYTAVVNGNNVVIGIPLGCTQGTWSAVCNDGTNSDNIADIICKNAGFSGGIQLPSNSSLYGHSPIPGTVYYSHFICPDTASSIDNCSPQNGGDHCYSGELDFVVQCTIPCYPSQVSFITSVNTTSNSVSYVTGSPTFCVNGNKLPICNGTSLNYNIVTRICQESTSYSLTVGFVGTPSGVTAPSFTDTNYVVTNLTCPDNEECTGTIGSSGCSSYGGGYAAVTCTRFCSDGDIRFYNNIITVVNGNNVIIGIPQQCNLGAWSSICNDGTNSDNLVDLICRLAGFTNGIQLPSNSSLYGRSPLPETVYYNHLTCPNNAVSIIQCSPQYVGDQCQLEFVVQCTVSSIPQVTCSPGHLGFNTTVNTTTNSVNYVTGTPTVCVNGNNLPICNGTSLDVNTVSRICLLSTGFTTVSGFIGTPSGVIAPSLTDINYVVTNLTCTNTFECTNTTGYSGCSSYGGGYATITCGRYCSDGVLRLYNNYTAVVDGNNVIIGIPQHCKQGAWSSICNDATNSGNIAEVACRLAGYIGGIKLSSNSSRYGRSPLPGTVYYNQYTCPNNADSFDQCSPQLARDQCYTGELDYVVQCTITTGTSGGTSDKSILIITIPVIGSVLVILIVLILLIVVIVIAMIRNKNQKGDGVTRIKYTDKNPDTRLIEFTKM